MRNIFPSKMLNLFSLLFQAIVGPNCTNSLVLFLQYARQLNFPDKPDYKYLKGLLQNELKEQKPVDEELEWTIKKSGSTSCLPRMKKSIK